MVSYMTHPPTVDAKYSQNRFFYTFHEHKYSKNLFVKFQNCLFFVIKIHYFDHIFLVYKDVYWHLKFFCTFPFGFISVWSVYVVPQGLRIFLFEILLEEHYCLLSKPNCYYLCCCCFFCHKTNFINLRFGQRNMCGVANVFSILINTFMCTIHTRLYQFHESYIF